MKLHIPVRLFRIVITLMAAVPCSLYAKYTAPTEIGIPARYETHIEVDDIGDIIDASKSSANVAFRVVENLYASDLNNFQVGSGSGSFYFTSHTPESLKSISVSDNTNRPFYVSNDQFLEFTALQHVSINSNTLLTSSDSYGGAIYGDTLSSITLSYNETVNFSKNTVSTNYSKGYCYGGAIYAKECYSITIRNNGAVTFSENTANPSKIYYSCGGAIYAEDCSIHLKDNDTITFNGNTASQGGAIYVGSSTNIFLSGNGVVTFNENTASSSGSAIYGGTDSTISLSDNGELSFIGNTGRAIDAGLRSNLSLSDNGTVTFTGNSGGAISGADRSYIILSNNGTVSFSENTADMGGAIFGEYRIDLTDNEKVTFSGNSATNGTNTKSGGGAIWGMAGVQIKNNSEVAFSGNSTKGLGGAIWVQGYIQLLDNEYVTFSNNSASKGGGAIGVSGSPITLSNNGVVTFSGNAATNNGGAIYAATKVITISDNKHISFYKNFVTYTGTNDLYGGGGAIRAGNTLALRNNETVTFSENTATLNGGAICGDYYVSLYDNGTVTFSGNLAKNGGAIYADLDLAIRNNDSVLFAGNVEKSGSNYLLRSIYATSNVTLSAAEGKSITFRDTMYIDSGATVSFNADYVDAEGVTHKQKGDILFTGATTQADLLAVKGSAGTVAEIRNSRTTMVNNLTNLYGGRLRVEDGAVYQGSGIMVHEGSGATVLVKDATLSHEGYSLEFKTGTELNIAGDSTISGNLQLMEGSLFTMQSGSVLTLCTGSFASLNGTVNMAEDARINLEKEVNVKLGALTISGDGAQIKIKPGNITETKNADISVSSATAVTLEGQLSNSSVENNGSGTLLLTNADNSLVNVAAMGGDIEVQNQEQLCLTSLTVGDNKTFAAYLTEQASPENEAMVLISGTASFGEGSRLNADLHMLDGSTLALKNTLTMGSDLHLDGNITLNGELLSTILGANDKDIITLITGIDTLYIGGNAIDSLTLNDGLQASNYFSNLGDENSSYYYYLVYDNSTPGEGTLKVAVSAQAIPEPTTATLSLLALAGLAARRRRMK